MKGGGYNYKRCAMPQLNSPGKCNFISLTCSLLKVLLEKLLRSCPGVKTVYAMVRSKAGQSPEARIADMINCKVRSGLNH